MEIILKLNKDFERCLEDLKKKYGEDFEYLNGVHPSQLDFSEFLDKFVAQDTMADATIDPNANASHKDIRSFITEKGKSEDKLFGLNKIFVEIKKKWGLRTAKQWLECEFSKAFYLNDSATASYFPYCYKNSEITVMQYKGNKLLTSFEQLYDLIEEPEEILNIKDKAICKYPVDLYVEDIVDNNVVLTKVTRIVKKEKTNNFRFIKTANGFSQIVTDNHPMITQRGDVEAKDLNLKEDKLTTLSTPKWSGDTKTIYLTDFISNNDYEVYYNGTLIDKSNLSEYQHSGQVYIKRLGTKKASNRFLYPTNNEIHLTKELGYIIGLSITDGCYNKGRLRIKQNIGKVSDRLEHCLQSCNILYHKANDNDVNVYTICSETLCEGLTSAIMSRAVSYNKKFNPNIINYNIDFISGVLGGFIDGDGTTGYKENTDRLIDGFSGFSNSRTLYNQIVYMLRCFGYLPKCFIPESTDTWFRFSAKMYTDKSYISIYSTKIEDNVLPRRTEHESLSKVRNGYNNSDDSAFVFANKVLASEDTCVYDITTETHHFLCNQILSHNCWANDFTRLATEGLFFLNGYNNQPPKHLTTYFDDVIEFVSFLSNRQSGAVGMPNVLIWAWYFWYKDVKNGYYSKDADTYLRQNFQKFIFRLNQPFLRIDQCAFTNVSIFDRPYLESLFGGLEFPDGTFAIDHIEDFIECQKVFMEVVSETRTDNMFTFPVLTYSLLYKDKKFIDESFARWCSDHNIKWSILASLSLFRLSAGSQIFVANEEV